MGKLTFKNQISLGLLIAILNFILNAVTRNGIFINLAWSIYGLIFFINPVPPKKYEDHPRIGTYIRITGLIILIFGLTSKFNF